MKCENEKTKFGYKTRVIYKLRVVALCWIDSVTSSRCIGSKGKMLFKATLLSTFLISVFATSRTSPPSGAIVVNPSTTTSGQFKTLSSAIASLDDTSTKSIFIYPGTYNEQVLVDRSGPLTVSFTEWTSKWKTWWLYLINQDLRLHRRYFGFF